MGDNPQIKQKVVPGRLKHFANAIAEFNDDMKINSRLAYLEGDDRVVADTLLYLQRISTLDG